MGVDGQMHEPAPEVDGRRFSVRSFADTHLTERQWVQVRTPAFKAWFGDYLAWFNAQTRGNDTKDRAYEFLRSSDWLNGMPFDGIVADDGHAEIEPDPRNRVTWGVFSPSGVKSATDNAGTFSGAMQDIRLADAEAMERSGADRLAIWRETGWWRG